ncbi:MAG: hypothetical protein WKF97_13850 [Chitinophagaceae bacterium]
MNIHFNDKLWNFKFEPGQRVLVRENEDCLYGNVVSVDGPFVEVQFDGMPHTVRLDDAFTSQLELCEVKKAK